MNNTFYAFNPSFGYFVKLSSENSGAYESTTEKARATIFSDPYDPLFAKLVEAGFHSEWVAKLRVVNHAGRPLQEYVAQDKDGNFFVEWNNVNRPPIVTSYRHKARVFKDCDDDNDFRRLATMGFVALEEEIAPPLPKAEKTDDIPPWLRKDIQHAEKREAEARTDTAKEFFVFNPNTGFYVKWAFPYSSPGSITTSSDPKQATPFTSRNDPLFLKLQEHGFKEYNTDGEYLLRDKYGSYFMQWSSDGEEDPVVTPYPRAARVFKQCTGVDEWKQDRDTFQKLSPRGFTTVPVTPELMQATLTQAEMHRSQMVQKLDETIKRIQPLTDKAAKLRAAIEAHDTRVRRDRVEGFATMILRNPALIDLLAPEHGTSCARDDKKRSSGCTRCALLDCRDTGEWNVRDTFDFSIIRH